MSEPLFSPNAIDAAAKYLRETMQAGKNLSPWSLVPRTRKQKWITLAEGVISAAITKDQSP